jgi:4-amino-4-deoxy-L-arabinose transferase-like glycosyltransferase
MAIVSASPPFADRLSPSFRLSVPLLLLGWCGVLFFYGLGAGDLRQNEGLRAQLGAEMLHSGDWATPTLYGEPLLTKPPGMYAAVALASWPLGGVTPWSARLPSALAATAAVLLVWRLFARRLSRRAGLAAALILPMSLMWLERVPSAEIDMLQLAWTVGALFCLLRALEEAEAGEGFLRQWVWMQGALLCTAGGLLTKWTAPAFFYLTAVPLLAWRRRLRLLLSPAHLLSVLVAAALCLAWAAAVIARVGWESFSDTISREMLLRLSPLHHPRPYPWGELITFPLSVLLPNLPWSLLAVATLRRGFAGLWNERQRRLLQLLHCWTWVNLLFWTAVPGHRPRHCLPLQPGLAGLAAFVVAAWLTGRLRLPRLRPALALAGFALLWLAVKLAYVHAVTPQRDFRHSPRPAGERLAAAVPPGQTVWLCRLKEDGVLFYSGLPARRAADLERLSALPGPLYVVLTEAEWRCWPTARPARVLVQAPDGQGGVVVLIAAP